jgi:hypothetical protein
MGTYDECINSSEFPEGILMVAREVLLENRSNLAILVSSTFAENSTYLEWLIDLEKIKKIGSYSMKYFIGNIPVEHSPSWIC